MMRWGMGRGQGYDEVGNGGTQRFHQEQSK
jgi:hypothetical protein